jgi:hypothetical protein
VPSGILQARPGTKMGPILLLLMRAGLRQNARSDVLGQQECEE